MRINNQITAPELRVIDEQGENLGVMSRDAALKMAAEHGQDLIEIAPAAKPPVAKIMAYDKYRYQQAKLEKKQKLSQKGEELKQIRISIRTHAHDLGVAAKKVKSFLEEGNRVGIQITLRGREKGKGDLAKQKLGDFLKMIDVEYKVVSEPRFGGYGLVTQIAKK